jgi:hypothetical protein
VCVQNTGTVSVAVQDGMTGDWLLFPEVCMDTFKSKHFSLSFLWALVSNTICDIGDVDTSKEREFH